VWILVIDMCSISDFKHSALPGKNYFRYLVLDPGTDNMPLTGRLILEDIDQAPEYDAISYVWGSPLLESEIICWGKSLRLTASLRDVLHHARLKDKTRNIWADQVCVNQADFVERSNQVALMAKIYEKSSATLIWLGDAPAQTANEVISLFRDVRSIVNQHLNLSDGKWSNMSELSSDDPLVSDKRWASLAQLARSPWFYRVWVVQEAGLSKRPQILYGKHNIEWDMLSTTLRWLRHRGRPIAYKYHLEWHAIHIDREAIWSKAATTLQRDDGLYAWSLLDILHNSRQLEATEPKDYIYAFLGHPLVRHASTDELIVSPDYTLELNQVFIDFASRWLEWTQDLNILAFVQASYSQGVCRSTKLPSWVPAWNRFAGSVLAQLGENLYDAGREVKSPPKYLKSRRLLVVEGVIFDKVEFASEVFIEKDFAWGQGSGSALPDTKRKWMLLLEHIFNQEIANTHINPEERVTELLYTMANAFTAGMVSSSREFACRAAGYLLQYLSEIEPPLDQTTFQIMKSLALPLEFDDFELQIAGAMINRRFAVTERGVFGLLPPTTKPGDFCSIIYGAKVPFIIRKITGMSENYEFIGESYINSAMKGEITQSLVAKGLQDMDIALQ
jgi:hypothetical protein